MAGIQVDTAAVRTPVTLADIKDHLRIDGGADDAILNSFVSTASEMIEGTINKYLIKRAVSVYFDSSPHLSGEINLKEGIYNGIDAAKASGELLLPVSPLISVISISYFTKDSVEVTWASTNYYADTVSQNPKIVLTEGGSWPTDLRRLNALRVKCEAGYGASASDIPAPIKQAIKELVAFMYEHRGEFERNAPTSMPKNVMTLLQQYKTFRFGASSFSTTITSGAIS